MQKTNESFTFGAEVSAGLCRSCISDTLKSFWNGFCCTASNITFVPHEENVLIIGDGEILPAEADGCTIHVTEKGAAVCANDRQSLLRGCMMLLQMIKPKCLDRGKERFQIPCCTVKDKPAVKNRMVHLCVFPETTLPFLQKFIRLCGALKYTHIVIEFWGMLKFDCLKELSWNCAFTKEQIRPLIEEARDLGLAVIPMFNHLGHAAAGRGIHGKHVVLDQNPRLQCLFDSDGWTWNIAEPRVRQLFQKIRQELCELCGSSFFHIGCDEAYRYGGEGADTGLLVRFLNETAEEIIREGRRPIMWGDMLLNADTVGVAQGYTCNCRSGKTADGLLSRLDRRIIIADWQYDAKAAPVKTTAYLSSLGFDTLCCPWYDPENIAACVKTAKDTSAFGVMLTTWHTLSAHMPSLLQCEEQLRHHGGDTAPRDYAAETAALVRKVYFADGDYKNAGWSSVQVGEITL